MSEDVGSVQVDAGSSGGDWRASLSDDIRNDPSLASIQDVNGLAKSFIHGQRMVGADKVVIPKDDASPDEMNDFYNTVKPYFLENIYNYLEFPPKVRPYQD